MEKETFKITLADGTVIEGLGKNGDNYISAEKLDESIFEDNCSPMSFEDMNGNVVTFQNGQFLQQVHYAGVPGYYLAFRDRTAQELAMEELQAKIDYLGMMTGVDI